MSFWGALYDFWTGSRGGATSDVHRKPSNGPPHSRNGFSLGVIEAMQFDPQVRIGIGARNGLLSLANVAIESRNERVVDYVSRLWRSVWNTSAKLLLRAKLYGFTPLFVELRSTRVNSATSEIEIVRIVDAPIHKSRLLMKAGQIVGFSLPRDNTRINILAPNALVCTFDADADHSYGCSLLERAYGAWLEKWTEGGVKDTLRLRMVKDAYIGDIFWYPPDRQAQLPNGQSVSWRDLARELANHRASGGALALPLLYDHEGRRLVDYTPPQDVTGATHIFEWKRDIDREIWKALEIPPEILEASGTGSGYSGRSIPFMVALASVQQEFDEIVRCVDRDLLRPLVTLQFGVGESYSIRSQSLVETYSNRANL